MTVGNPVCHPILILLISSLTWLTSSCVTMVRPAQTLAKEYYNLGNAWFDMKKYDQAARAYLNALTWDPDLKIATLNLARTKAEMGDPAAAMDLVAPLAETEPDNLAVAQYRAWLTARWKGPAAAADFYLDLARRLPGDAVTQYNAGLCLAAADRNEEALAALRLWKSLDGKTPAGLTALANVLEKSGSSDVAEAWYDVVHSLPDNDARRFRPLVARAKALEKAELYGDALTAWDAALALPTSQAPAAQTTALSAPVTSSPASSTTSAPSSTPSSKLPASSPATPLTVTPASPSAAPALASTSLAQAASDPDPIPKASRAEAQFRRAKLLLLHIEDYDLGSAGLIEAWKAGYHDQAAWKELLDSPLLTTPTRLRADLKLAGVAL